MAEPCKHSCGIARGPIHEAHSHARSGGENRERTRSTGDWSPVCRNVSLCVSNTDHLSSRSCCRSLLQEGLLLQGQGKRECWQYKFLILYADRLCRSPSRASHFRRHSCAYEERKRVASAMDRHPAIKRRRRVSASCAALPFTAASAASHI